MVNYICPRCNYKSNYKNDIKRHINKKDKCLVVQGGLDIDVRENQDILLGKIDPIQYLRMKKELDDLKKKYNSVITSTTNNYNNCQIDNSVNIQLIINNYNEPNTAYILSQHCDQALKNGNLIEGCIQMARLIWFNGNHPENHSIFKTNKKDDSVKCLEDGIINEYTLNSKFQKILEVILMVFERSEKESEKFYDLNDIFDNPDKHEKFYKRLENELGKELYNHKELVKQTIQKFQRRN